MLERNFLKISMVLLILMLLASCNNYPLVTPHQLDATNNQVNPFKITKYNQESCKLETESQPSFQIATCPNGDKPIINPLLNGHFSLSPKDVSEVKAKAKSDCENKKQNTTGEF